MKESKFVLRIPSKINNELERRAKQKQWSKNTLIKQVLSSFIENNI